MAMMLRIDPVRLRALRLARSLTPAEIAKRSGLTQQSITRAERIPTKMYDTNAEAIAKVLGCSVADFEVGRFDPSSPTGLERLVQRERSRGESQAENDGIRVWNATALHEVSEAWELHDGRSYLVRGAVTSFRRASELEAAVLDPPERFCVRALVAVPTRDEVTLDTTLHALYTMHAERLQRAMREGLNVTAVAIVTVARVADGRVVAEDCGEGAAVPGDGTAWNGFEKLGSKAMQPWALRVELLEQPTKPGRG